MTGMGVALPIPCLMSACCEVQRTLARVVSTVQLAFAGLRLINKLRAEHTLAKPMMRKDGDDEGYDKKPADAFVGSSQ